MIKKIVPMILCIVLVFSISASATNTADSEKGAVPAASEGMPMEGGRPGGGRGGMGMPRGEIPVMPNGERPAMPDGEMPTGGMTQPQDSENAGPENSQQAMPANGENESEAIGGETADGENRMHRGDFGGGMPGNMNGGVPENIQNAETGSKSGISGFMKTYSTPVTSVILLGIAFVFVIFYKRKSF